MFLGITGEISRRIPARRATLSTAPPVRPTPIGDWDVGCQADGMTVFDVDAVYGGIFLKGGTRNYTDWEAPELNNVV